MALLAIWAVDRSALSEARISVQAGVGRIERQPAVGREARARGRLDGESSTADHRNDIVRVGWICDINGPGRANLLADRNISASADRMGQTVKLNNKNVLWIHGATILQSHEGQVDRRYNCQSRR